MLALALVLLLGGGGGGGGRAALTDLLPAAVTDNFEQLLNAAAAACEVLPLEVIFSRQVTWEMPHLDVVEFTEQSYRAHKALHPPATSLPRGEPTLIYVPGWWNTPSDESTQALVSALLRRNSAVLVLDTRLAFCRGYVGAASRVNAVAHLLYRYIEHLAKKGVPLASIHLIGFSLGAHVVGMAGRLVSKNSNVKVGRITALDPARPCFAQSATFRLNKADAEHVQVVHTSAGVLGLAVPLGHVDLYVGRSRQSRGDCGRVQLQCDHARAWRLFAASVSDAGALTASRCRSLREVRRGRCSGNLTRLGYTCAADTRGMFLMTDGSTQSSELLRRAGSERQVTAFNPFDVFSWFS